MTGNHLLVGTKVRLVAGDVVVEEEPAEDGFVMVKTRDGTVGSLPTSHISKNYQKKSLILKIL